MDEREFFEKRVGTTLLGKWTLDRLLGIGGMAAVYEATHKIGRKDAIKILHAEVARQKDVRARFEQEAHAVNRFRHAGAVEVRDIDVTEDGSPFLVMELLDGEPLGELAKRDDALPLERLLGLVDELLDVLAAAHAQGIIHRDIKPDNLFVLRDGRLKVLDFGIARMREGAPNTMKTKTGAALGTLTYMAPEQVRGGPIDARADLFGVGATMFRLLAKRRIHEARVETELLVKMATEPAPPLADVAPAIPRDVCAVVDRALAFDRERRYPDARAMQDDVRALRRGVAPSAALGAASAPAPHVRAGAATVAAASAATVADAVPARSTRSSTTVDLDTRTKTFYVAFVALGFLVFVACVVGVFCSGSRPTNQAASLPVPTSSAPTTATSDTPAAAAPLEAPPPDMPPGLARKKHKRHKGHAEDD